MTQIYWIPINEPGQLAILPRPRGGDWLADEVRQWRSLGVTHVVSALDTFEEVQLELTDERSLCEESGIVFSPFPIPDRSTPETHAAADLLIHDLARLVRAGNQVAVHCRMGIGRSGLLTTCTLIALGLSADEALLRVSTARGYDIPDTREQLAWIHAFANREP